MSDARAFPRRSQYRNPLRQKLKEGKATFGLWITMANPAVTEIAAELGLDWVCIDMEHGATDFVDIANHLRAAKGSDLCVFVRVSRLAQDTIARCLDLGADGIVVPLVRTADDVRQALAYMKYPTAGCRGLGGERAQKWGMDVGNYIETANDELIFMPMIEHIDAVRNIDEILAVPGLDCIFVGPGDLSSSLGEVGTWEGTKTPEAIRHVVERARAHGTTVGIYANGAADARARCDQGFRIVAIGSDLPFMIAGIRREIDALPDRASPSEVEAS